MHTLPRRHVSLALFSILSLSTAAQAVMIYDSTQTNNAGQNTSSLSDHGYVSVGHNGVGGATAISPHTFLTANHLGVGSTIELNGTNYDVTNSAWISGSDLRVVQVAQTIPAASIAPLYLGTDEMSPTPKTITFIGYGGPPGGVSGSPDLTGKGWYWTSPVGTRSWATTALSDTYSDSSGDYLRFAFGPTNGSGTFSTGDSGGGAFVLDGGVWKLIGVGIGVDLFYPSDGAPDVTIAALYDTSTFYTKDENNVYSLATEPQHSYLMRVSSYAAAIGAQVAIFEAVPEPASLGVLAAGTVALLLRRRIP